jgi:hypothetical protein
MQKFIFLLTVAGFFSCQPAKKSNYSDYPIRQVNLNDVELTDDFWLPKIQTVQKKTIKYALDKCKSEGRFESYRKAQFLRYRHQKCRPLGESFRRHNQLRSPRTSDS